MASSGFESNKIHVDLATKEELQTVPGVGPKIAEAIIRFREANKGTISKLQLASIPHVRVSPEMWDMLAFEEEGLHMGGESEGESSDGGEDEIGVPSKGLDGDAIIDKITSVIDNADLRGPPISLAQPLILPAVRPKTKTSSKSAKTPTHLDPALNTGKGTGYMYSDAMRSFTKTEPTPGYPPPLSGFGQVQPPPQHLPTHIPGVGAYQHPSMYGWPNMPYMMPYMPPGYPVQPGTPQTPFNPQAPFNPYGYAQPYIAPQPAQQDQQHPAQPHRQPPPVRTGRCPTNSQHSEVCDV